MRLDHPKPQRNLLNERSRHLSNLRRSEAASSGVGKRAVTASPSSDTSPIRRAAFESSAGASSGASRNAPTTCFATGAISRSPWSKPKLTTRRPARPGAGQGVCRDPRPQVRLCHQRQGHRRVRLHHRHRAKRRRLSDAGGALGAAERKSAALATATEKTSRPLLS